MFENKVVIVTGASSGIGEQIALAFAKEGADLVITYKENKKGAEEIASKIKKENKGKVLIVQADLTIDLEASNVAEKTMREFGKIDILINNAGRYISGDEWNGKAEIWNKSLQQSLISVMSMSKYVIEIFQNQKFGDIINISSRYSTRGQADALAYSAAKAGVVNITQAYAKILAPFGRVNAISPGAAKAGYWLKEDKEEVKETLENVLLEKLVEPKEIAEIVLFLASDKAKSITGQNIFVDGGYGLK
jgi:NAD(P)-dependent dehydrogenase (short-subunit alcohol dehydrogenase family)